jgi:ATP-dependent RNA helicase DeaD
VAADTKARDSGSALPGFTVDEPSAARPAVRAEGRPDAPVGEAPGFLELFVNIGRREGVRTSDLEELLSGKGIAQADMGGIRIRDRMTFISVKKEALDRVTAALAGQVIGGRTVVAELARGRG